MTQVEDVPSRKESLSKLFRNAVQLTGEVKKDLGEGVEMRDAVASFDDYSLARAIPMISLKRRRSICNLTSVQCGRTRPFVEFSLTRLIWDAL